MKRSVSIAILAVLAGGLSLVAGPVRAHGELQGADPEPNAHLKSAPSNLTMTFTEAPSSDSVIKVLDGCRTPVVERNVVDGNDFVAQLATGQPGKWRATFRVISAEDGHLTKGTYSFQVAGKKDCSNHEGGDDATPGAGDGSDASGNTPDGGGDFPIVPVVVAAVALVVVGAIVRRVSAR